MAGSPSSFRRHSDDTTRIQRKVRHDYILRIREAMQRVMEELTFPLPEPHWGAVWATAINLMYCYDLAERIDAGTNARLRTAVSRRRTKIGRNPC